MKAKYTSAQRFDRRVHRSNLHRHSKEARFNLKLAIEYGEQAAGWLRFAKRHRIAFEDVELYERLAADRAATADILERMAVRHATQAAHAARALENSDDPLRQVCPLCNEPTHYGPCQ